MNGIYFLLYVNRFAWDFWTFAFQHLSWFTLDHLILEGKGGIVVIQKGIEECRGTKKKIKQAPLKD